MYRDVSGPVRYITPQLHWGKKDLMEEYWLKHDALGPYLVCNAI